MIYNRRFTALTSSILVPLYQSSFTDGDGDVVRTSRRAWCDPSNASRDAQSLHQSVFYDYVVIGLGTSGREAVKEILSNKSKNQRLLMIDPEASSTFSNILPAASRETNIKAHNSTVASFSPYSKELVTIDGLKVQFGKCLIAVGAAAPPIPKHFIDSECMELFLSRRADTSSEKDIKKLFDTVSNGGHVTLVGANSWETVELAGRLAVYARETAGLRHSVTLMFPAYGPMAGSLPRYLSQSVMRRLASRGVDVLPYSQIRYIDRLGGSSRMAMRPNRNVDAAVYSKHAQPTNTAKGGMGLNAKHEDGIVVFTAKSYDSLVTSSFATDMIAFAPTSVPSLDDSTFSNTAHTEKAVASIPMAGNEKMVAHSHDYLLNCGLEIDRVGGGLLVNTSLEACSGVFVAGDIASVYLNHSNGLRYRGLYRGWAHAAETGRVAGFNMVATSSPKMHSKIYNHIPIYEGENAETGLRLAMVGNCSSALDSHGFWWKMLSKQQSQSGDSEFAVPPLGLGVVFYLHLGRIVGVLLSGFPTSQSCNVSSSGGESNLHGAQIQAMHSFARHMIGTSVDDLVDEAFYRININAQEQGLTKNHSVRGKFSDTAVSSLLTHKIADSPSTIGPPLILSSTTDHLSERVLMLHSLTRRAATVISPLLSPELVKVMPAAGGRQQIEISLKDVGQCISHYPRPVHRYGLSSRAFVKELTDQSAASTIRPAIPREALFQLTNNSGSREDRLSAAYSRGIINGWSPPGIND